MKKILSVMLVALLALSLFAGCGPKAQEGVTVGSKQFTENILLSEIYAQLIEAKTDIPVTRKLNLGGTSVCMPAMQNGEIDIYFEYTGTAYNEILKLELTEDVSDEDIQKACIEQLNADYGIKMFDPIGINNTYALAIKTARMDEFNISSIRELALLSSNLRFGAGHTFYTRIFDGYDGIVETYGLHFTEALKMDSSLLYEAVDKDELDIIVVFSTDSLLKKYDMTVLEDDKHVFPPYQGAPMCLNSALEKYPELNDVLNTLSGKIDDTMMQDLNYEVDVNNRSVEDVAAEFLKSNGYV